TFPPVGRGDGTRRHTPFSHEMARHRGGGGGIPSDSAAEPPGRVVGWRYPFVSFLPGRRRSRDAGMGPDVSVKIPAPPVRNAWNARPWKPTRWTRKSSF